MSGFAGMISLAGANPDPQVLEQIARRLAFRGPDGTHIHTQHGAGFCFTFLRTGPAPQCPSQPCSLDGRVWFLGDVRLDGRDDLRLKLEQHGETLDPNATDEELVLRVWRLWGEEGVGELTGDYAFALWDVEARQLRCWRDLMGAKPFFYASAGEWLYFANTLEAIRRAPGVSQELDEHFIGDFLLDGWCHYRDRTAFRAVSRLPGGHAFRYTCTGIDVRRYSALPIEEPLCLKREEEYVEQFRGLLEQAVLERLPRGPAAILMSGGLDSTSVAAVAMQCAKKRGLDVQLRAFTADYQPLFDDKEGALASIAAQHIGIPIEIQWAASYLPYERWQASPPALPEPCHEPLQYQYVEQSRQIARHAPLALNGHGGDGVLTGQAWPYFVHLVRTLRVAPVFRDFGGYFLEHGRLPPLRGGFRAKLRRIMNLRDGVCTYPRWLTSEFETRLRLNERWRELTEKPRKNSHHWYPRAHDTLNNGHWPTTLESDDPASTAVAVEMRSPFLDARIQRFLLRVPPVPLCINKELIRRMSVNLLPEAIRLRPKTPFEGDQVALHVKKHGWSPFPLAEPPAVISRFVTWERLYTALQETPIRFPWPDLRPISLLYWIRRIENESRIQ